MTNKLKYIVFLLLFGLLATAFTAVKATPTKEIEVVIFVGEGCPHCAQMEEAFYSLQQSKFPQAKLIKYELYHNPDNQWLFAQYGKAFGVQTDGVPLTLIGNAVIYGANIEKLSHELEKCSQVACPAPSQLLAEKLKDLDLTKTSTRPDNDNNYTIVGWIVIIMLVLIIFVVVVTQMKRKPGNRN